jgi:hypothetical protein
MVWNQMSVQSESADPHWIGREWLRKTKVKIDRMRAARAGLPAERMLDVHYEAMDRDWRREMGRVYEFLDMDIDPAVPAMTEYVARNERNPFRSHRYDLADFGLDRGAVHEAFADYVEAFDIPVRLNGHARPL